MKTIIMYNIGSGSTSTVGCPKILAEVIREGNYDLQTSSPDNLRHIYVRKLEFL